jgi:hypothetical protein
MKTLPVEFESRMKALLGDEFECYKASLEKEPVRSFRVNTDKISLEDFSKIIYSIQKKSRIRRQDFTLIMTK